MRAHLYFFAALILLIGLGSSLLIYLKAGNDSEVFPGYENSKIYIHDLELYG